MPQKSAESTDPTSSTPTPRRHPHLGLPLSLRRAPAQRKPSTPHLSVVFADPSLSHGGAAPSRPGTLASEDALARQMNAGGQEIGLRSRRSSSATVRTLSGVPSPSVEEEPEAGPSTPRKSDGDLRAIPIGEEMGERDENMVQVARRLNAKQSSSWLRWNAPSGFPRSRTGSMAGVDKGKGKAKDMGDPAQSTVGDGEAGAVQPAATPSSEPISAPSPAAAADILPAPPLPPEPPTSGTAAELASISPPPTIRTTARTYRNNWWGRPAVSPAPSVRRPSVVMPEPLVVEQAPDAAAAVPPLISASPPLPSAAAHLAPVGPERIEPPAPSKLLETAAALSDPPAAPAPASTTSGWRSYIWGNPAAPPLPPGESASDDNTAALVPDLPPPGEPDATPLPTDVSTATSTAGPAYSIDPQPPGSALASASPITSDDPPPPSTTQVSGSGWGTFLYSIILPQVAIARSLDSTSSLSHQPGAYPSEPPPPPSSTEVPVNPTVDQRPEPTSQPPISGLPNPPTTTSPLSTNSDTLAPSLGIPDAEPPMDSARKASTTTTAGWLSYLAYRSTQKKITSGSVRSGNTVAGRNSSEMGEEVMDLSADPDFPVDSGPTGKKADQALGAVADKEKMPPPKSIPAKAPSANLAVRGKRLSVSSIRSAGAAGGTLTPLSSSPKAPGPLDAKHTPSASPRPSSIASSALPPPPLVPAQQPNLVIPTFDNTFDRPPRSFLPLPPPAPPPSAESTATPGLAWRALSVAGSYVYSGAAAADKGKGKEKPVEDESKKEARGRKEGRGVGGDLPRRVGLGGGEPDEGWRGVKRVVVVGVHGWFPAKMLNSVIGEPTGTSQKFANMMGAAVKQFFSEQGMEEEIRLTLMPLEGEGTIDARVDRLYKAYLSNPAWINDLRRADAIFFAAHSQGCIVTTHLLSRMIAQGHIRTPLNTDAVARCEWAFGPIGVVPDARRSPLTPSFKSRQSPPPTGSEGGYQKVAMLAMCGVHLGPLYSISTSTVIQPYLQWFENAAARELFEFQESTSAVSLAYQKALGMVLENGVKVVLLASLNDQVVPIYGASFSTANHPLLLRALFVDGASYSQTDFMTNLLCFAFMLRNAGLDDQRLIEHLSEATAGSLTGVGHSTPYEEPQSYALAVKYLFLSGPAYPSHSQSSASSPSTSAIPPLHIEPFSARDTRNEFELPWIMRALVDSPEVKDLFPGELRDLKEGVGAWKPVTKVLKEVKKRLEPMAGRQSKLRPIPNSPSSASLNVVGGVGTSKEPSTLGSLKRDW